MPGQARHCADVMSRKMINTPQFVDDILKDQKVKSFDSPWEPILHNIRETSFDTITMFVVCITYSANYDYRTLFMHEIRILTNLKKEGSKFVNYHILPSSAPAPTPAKLSLNLN